MKKLLLSSTVMFFLCTVSFAQQNKQVTIQKNKKSILNQDAQVALEKKKISDYEASEKSLTPEQKSNMETEKMKAQLLEKQHKLALKNAQKADIDPRSLKGQ